MVFSLLADIYMQAYLILSQIVIIFFLYRCFKTLSRPIVEGEQEENIDPRVQEKREQSLKKSLYQHPQIHTRHSHADQKIPLIFERELTRSRIVAKLVVGALFQTFFWVYEYFFFFMPFKSVFKVIIGCWIFLPEYYGQMFIFHLFQDKLIAFQRGMRRIRNFLANLVCSLSLWAFGLALKWSEYIWTDDLQIIETKLHSYCEHIKRERAGREISDKNEPRQRGPNQSYANHEGPGRTYQSNANLHSAKVYNQKNYGDPKQHIKRKVAQGPGSQGSTASRTNITGMSTRSKLKGYKAIHTPTESPHSYRHDGRLASPFENEEELLSDMPFVRNQSMADFDFQEPDNRKYTKLNTTTMSGSMLRQGTKYIKPGTRLNEKGITKKKTSGGNRSYYDEPRY